MYGWRDAVNLQHAEACRARIEAELAKTDKGMARIKLSKSRFEKRQAAAIAEDLKDHDKEEEKAAAMPRENSQGGPPRENLPELRATVVISAQKQARGLHPCFDRPDPPRPGCPRPASLAWNS